jgi:hypothetical protein
VKIICIFLVSRLDYEGQRVKINTLAPQTAYSVQTHPSHPWIFRDSDTNETLVIKKLNVKGSFFETSDYLVSQERGWKKTKSGAVR